MHFYTIHMLVRFALLNPIHFSAVLQEFASWLGAHVGARHLLTSLSKVFSTFQDPPWRSGIFAMVSDKRETPCPADTSGA